MKKIVTIVLCLLSPVLFSQTDPKPVKGFSKEEKRDSIKVIDNKMIGYSNTIFAKVKGRTSDYRGTGVDLNLSLTNLDSKKTTFYETNDEGFFDIDIEKGMYSMTFSKRSYGDFEIEKIDLSECQIQEININLGSRITIVHYTIIEPEVITLTSTKKKKKKKKKK
ncbi:carboxypeptidase-like regulatory domain-containing protein [Flavobacterium reichenbachii]|uniref:Carboxypeptidase regulatory-like domain-containing protein n=1 Tax=Flavobacterium reichenbachii TaxID=362418 RepID=A0A085ZQJ5_9FLAO|nr:carboxypeptidase-like regulatory domain-containing protein [Flavobacterium reichenbachii]KFF06709.1 hypothetical protein IW19_14875 [Flavobacterium reichenbachii]OXB18687.1 hypothetical protein B0A68_01330 [Flavobacterium reichenbachii]